MPMLTPDDPEGKAYAERQGDMEVAIIQAINGYEPNEAFAAIQLVIARAILAVAPAMSTDEFVASFSTNLRDCINAVRGH